MQVVTTKDVRDLVVERVDPEILHLLEAAGEAAEAEGIAAYVVGGFVRDLLLGIDNVDVDIVVEGEGLKVARRLAETVGAKVSPHEQFGTAVLALPDGFRLDVATARKEHYEYPAAPPVVEPSSLKDDLFRRDFTVNTLAVKLNGPDAFHLVDFFGAQGDLKERTIRVLHDLSFVEDPARIFRAIRFEQRYDFTIGPQTTALLEDAVARDLLGELAPARLGTELRYLLEESQPEKMVRRMAELDVLRFIHPGLTWEGDTSRLLQGLHEVLARDETLDLSIERWFCFLLALLDGLPPEEARECGLSLSLPAGLQGVVECYGEQRDHLSALLRRSPPPRPSELYRALEDVAPEVLLVLMAREEEEEAGLLSHYLTATRTVEPAITGDDLIAMGLEPGPDFKEIIEEVRDRRIDGELETRDEEMAFVREKYAPPAR